MSGPGDLLGLADTDVDAPPVRPAHVPRDRLLRLLPAAPDPAVVLLVAPAGYGKTTLLSQWAEHDDRPFAWMGVDEGDNDPVRLLRHVSLALGRVTPIDDELLQALHARDADPRAVVLPRLIDWLTRHDSRGVLVLDDLHRLHDATSLAVVAALAAGLPGGWLLAVASRRRPEVNLVPVAGRHARGRQYVELGRDELAFDAREAAAVLEHAGVALPADVVGRLVRRVEGWPAAVYLSALSVRESPDPAAGLTTRRRRRAAPVGVRPDRRPGPAAGRHRRTSSCARPSSTGCPVPCATRSRGRRGRPTVLAELSRSNLFVMPQDRRGEWYRYHRLFRDVLRAELRHRDPAAEARLHRLAAAWFAGNGRPEDAVTHALAGGDVASAARLVTSCAQALANAGRIRTARRWVEEIGDRGVAEYPPYAVIAGWVWAMEGDGRLARRFLVAGGARRVRRPAGRRQRLPGVRGRPAALRDGAARRRRDDGGRPARAGARASGEPVVPPRLHVPRHGPRAPRLRRGRTAGVRARRVLRQRPPESRP